MATGNTVPGSMTGTANTSTDTVSPTGRGLPDGYASLDSGGQVPAGQLGHAGSGGGLALTQTAVKTSAYTAAAGQIVPVNTTIGNVTITLPSAPAGGTAVAVKHIIQGGTNTVTVACAGSDVLNKAGGSVSMTLPLLAQGVLLEYNAGIWMILADDLALTQLDARYAAYGTAGGTPLLLTAAKTANYTATAGQAVPCDISGGSFTVTLPSAPAAGTMVSVEITAVSGVGVNALTVTCGGSDTFDAAGGSTSVTLTLQHQSQLFAYGGGVWARVAGRDSYLEVASARLGTVYLDQYAGTDDAKMALALTAVVAAGGGTIQLSPRAHTFASQWATTYVSASSTTGIRIRGAGVAFNGAWSTVSAATVCTFTYTGAGTACMDFQHNGTIELEQIQFKSANLGVPLFQTTNACPSIHDCIFSGGGTGFTCATDAILLGGTGTTIGSGDTAKYNAYQGVIFRNFFDGTRRFVYFQSAANSIQVHDNTISDNCGTNLFLGAAFEMTGNSSKTCTGNSVYGNCIELTNYYFAGKLTYASQNTIGPNGLFDQGSAYTASYYTDPHSSSNNFIDGGRTSPSAPFVWDSSGSSNNRVQTMQRGGGQIEHFNTQVIFDNNSGPPRSNYFGETIIGVDPAANQSYWRTMTNGAPQCALYTIAATTFTDGNLVNGSFWVTSATAAFVFADVGRVISGGTIPSATTVGLAVTATTAFPWQPSYVYAAGDVARPVTANAHLYQVTVAGTSSSSAPTWPTGGGTVTDGGVTWTDLGTVTAAYMTAVPTATATGVTLSLARTGTAVEQILFDRTHVVSQGSAPAIAAKAGAGTGATASIAGTDTASAVTVTCGTSTAAGQLATVTFATPWSGTPRVAATALDAGTAALLAGGYYLTVSAAAITLSTVSAPTASTVYTFSLVAVQ